jgi:hypothetical protein
MADNHFFEAVCRNNVSIDRRLVVEPQYIKE